MTTLSRRSRRVDAARGQPRRSGYLARADAATLALAHERLKHLYEISKLLTRFVSARRTLADILLIVTEGIPLATATLLLEGRWGQRMMLWHAEGLGADRQRAAEEHARRRYADLVQSTHDARLVANVSLFRAEALPAEVAPKRFVSLPLAVEGSPIFGALQIESLRPLDEVDLGFVNAVVNQLAVALDRKALVDARQEAADAKRASAERQRSQAHDQQVVAEAAEQRYRALVNNLDHAFVWEADARTLQVSYVSAPAQQLLGHRLERWTASPDFWLEILHPAEREIFRVAVRKALAEGRDERLDHRVIAADGSSLWLHTGIHIASEGGDPLVQAVSVDITTLKEGEARDRLLAEASRVVVAAVDYNDLIEMLARSAVPALGEVCVLDMLGENGQLEPAAAAFADPDDVELAESVRKLAPGSSGQTLKAQVLSSRAPLLLQGDAATAMVGASGPRSILALPLLAHGRGLGVITLASLRPDRYSPAAVALAEEFALRAALVLDNAWLYRDAERRSQRHQTVTDNAEACLILVDADDHPTFMNPAAATATGYRLGDLAPTRLHDVLHGAAPAGAPASGRAKGAASTGALRWTSPTQAQEDTFVRRDGRSFPVSCNAVVLASGGAVVEFRDLTIEKQAERFRELFVGMLGHDLRNPLGAILMSASLVLQRGALGEKDERALQRIVTAAERMSRMIEQILDFARGRLGGGIPIARKRIDLCELVKRIVDEVVVAHSGRAFDLVMPFACEGAWDPDRLEQVVSNLVGNAIAHGRKDLPIRIRLVRAAEAVEIQIWNDGEPIPADLVPGLFDPFRRGAGRGGDPRGLGLGLYITERIVHAHGGTIQARSTAEEGTTFTATLPLGGSAPPPR